MKFSFFLLLLFPLLFSCQKENIEPGTYVSEFKLADHVKYKWLGTYRLAGKDSLILRPDNSFQYFALCSGYQAEGTWSTSNDTLYLEGDLAKSVPHYYFLKKERLHGISNLGSTITLRRILGKQEP